MQKVITKEIESGKQILLLSDLHADNPKADLKYIRKVLDEAVKRDARIHLNGDTFCLMQGRYDPRASKDDIRPEHWGGNYFDKVVNWMCDLLEPYAHHIDWIGQGNHESASYKRHETDVVDRLVTLLNYKTGSSIEAGAYKNWIYYKVVNGKHRRAPFRIFAHHGFGGGGPVTKGVIQNQRLDAALSNADMVWQGHVHERYVLETVKEHLHTSHGTYRVIPRTVYHVRTSTFKEEANTGVGFHIERGRNFKPLGGYWMTLHIQREREGGHIPQHVVAQFESTVI